MMTTEHICFDKTCNSRNRSEKTTLVLLKWNDASYQGGPLYLGGIVPGVIMETGGILIQESDTHYSIAMDQYKEDATFRHITNIPKGMVTEIRKFVVEEDEKEENNLAKKVLEPEIRPVPLLMQ